MTSVNLLPWRESLRKRKQKNYIILLSITALIACSILFGVFSLLELKIATQEKRNQYLQQEMSVVDAEIREIKKLKEQKAALIERVDLVRSLQNTRPVVVHLFDEIARSMPDDLYLTEISFKKQKLLVKGVAKDNRLVAALIRQLDDSEWLTDPNLNRIQTTGSGESQFELNISLEYPKRKGATDGSK